MIRYFLFYLTLINLFACQTISDPNGANAPTLRELPVSSRESGEANLFASASGAVYLSWVEYINDSTDALQFSKLEQTFWSSPKTITSGNNWFVNWADFPSLVAYAEDDQALAAHWLQMRAEGTYDYDVHITQSFDGGANWSESFIPHRDSIAAEHGFVTMLPLPGNKMFATWLDGRNTKVPGAETNEHDHGGHGHHGAMTLRAATFDRNGQLEEEAELDPRICDCCQTSAALTDQGVIVVYRDRSEDEVRDISIVRQVDGSWTAPQRIANDNWKIAGCPVNGPAVAANGSDVAVAWYTMVEKVSRVQLAFSDDGGATFSSPVQIDDGQPLGRVDVLLLSSQEALVSWVEQTDTAAEIRAVKVNRITGRGEPLVLTTTASSRNSGFPKMVKSEDQIIVAWTAVDSLTKIKSAILDL